MRILKIACIPDDRMLQVSFNKYGKLDFTLRGVSEMLDKNMDSSFQVETLLLPFIVNRESEVEHIYIDFKKYNVVVNTICEPDICKQALYSAVNLLRQNHSTPVINHPKLILQFSRDKIYEIMKGIDCIYLPRVIRIKPSSLNDIKQITKEKNILPFIFRKVGEHTLHDAELIKSTEDIKELEKYPFMGEEYYLVEFVNYVSHDGLFRKYRVFLIDGKIYPRTMIVSDYWNIHGRDRQRIMDKYDIYRNEEKEWLEGFNEAQYECFKKIYEKLKADVFIIDFGVLPNGRIVVFEISPCFKYEMSSGTSAIYSYQAQFILAIKQAIRNMIVDRAKATSDYGRKLT